MSGYLINVTQDAAARISQETEMDVCGIFTNGVESCTVYIFIGENNRVSFCHASFAINPNSLLTELEWTRPLKKWFVVINTSHKRVEASERIFQKLCSEIPRAPELMTQSASGLCVTYHREMQSITLDTGHKPTTAPVIMPPFADKALCLSVLNSALANIGSINLQLLYDEKAWSMSNNETDHLKDLIRARNQNRFEQQLELIPKPQNIQQGMWPRIKQYVAHYIKSLLTSCGVDDKAMFEFYSHTWALRRLKEITSYPFVGTLDRDSYLTAWLYLTNRRDAESVASQLGFYGHLLRIEQIANEANSMTPYIYVVRIRNINVTENLEKLND